MQIFVKMFVPKEPTFSFDVEPSTYVEELTKMIWDKGVTGFHHPELIKVHFGGKQLENGRTLQECGVRPGSTLFAVTRLRGGSRRRSRVRKNRRNTRRRH